MLFGRRTFDGMAAHWSNETGAVADRMNAVEKVVATRKGDVAAWNNSRILKGDVSKSISALKAESDKKDIFVFGSADLTTSLLEANAVDEVRLCLVPIILGGGNPLFKNDGARKDLELIESRPFKSGGVLLRYKRGGV